MDKVCYLLNATIKNDTAILILCIVLDGTMQSVCSFCETSLLKI